MGSKKIVSQKIFEYKLKSRNPKSPVFYATILVAVLLFMYVESIYSNSRLHSIDLTSHETVEEEYNAAQAVVQIESTTTDIDESSMSVVVDSIDDILSMEENVDVEEEEEETDTENYDPLIPPENVSKEERIAWFRRQLPELEILQSSTLSQQFHSRVFNFLNGGCSVLFHIIWLSPAQSFGKREFLTMDTLFNAHPQGCLLIISRSMDSKRGYRILKPLLDRGFKVHAITPDLPFLVKDTPAEAWLEEMKSGNKDPGYIPLSQNLSNLIRLAMLYKYGGVYLDTDFIVLKPFTGLRNCIGAQSIDSGSKHWTRLNNAVMIFDMNHPLLLRFINEFALTFDGNKWGHNGPYLVSRVVGRLGDSTSFNFTILPPMAFYPADWIKIGQLFEKPKTIDELKWVDAKLLQLSGETYGVHLWNKQSRRLMIEDGSVIVRLISDHCVICNYVSATMEVS